jgi:hypothetical protein
MQLTIKFAARLPRRKKNRKQKRNKQLQEHSLFQRASSCNYGPALFSFSRAASIKKQLEVTEKQNHLAHV